MKQKLARKIRQQLRDLINLLAEIKLKEKEGTQRSCKIRCLESLTVPIWVTMAKLPFGNFTREEMVAVIEVNNDIVLIIWSVAPVSIIQEWRLIEELCGGKCEVENTECFMSKETETEAEEITEWTIECFNFERKEAKEKGMEWEPLPPILENKWSWELTTWCAEGDENSATELEVDDLIRASSCWICSWDIDSWGT